MEKIKMDKEKIKELENKLEEVQNELAKLREADREWWLPEWLEENVDFWFCDRYGDLLYITYKNRDAFNQILKYRKVFKTEKDAEQYRDAILTRNELEAMADVKAPLQDNILLYFIRYGRTREIFFVDNNYYLDAPFAFTTKEKAQQALETIGIDRLNAMRAAGVTV